MSFFLVVEKVRLAGRDADQPYVNVGIDARTDRRSFTALQNLPPWNKPEGAVFIIELSELQYQDYQTRRNPLFYDGQGNLPRWQVNGVEIGSWVDPVDDASVWQIDVPLPDTRYIVRAYDDRPQAGAEINDVGLATTDAAVTVYIKLFEADDTPAVIDELFRGRFAGQLMELPFGSEHPNPPVQSGESSFLVLTDVAGTGRFISDGKYRWVLLSGEPYFPVVIYKREIFIETN